MVKGQIEDLASDYAASGFGKGLIPGDAPALLLVDWARAYFEPDSPLYAGVEAERVVAARLVGDARAGGRPIIFTRVEYVPGDPAKDGGHFYRKVGALRCFDRGNPLGDFTPSLAPLESDHVVTKQWPSAFFDTDLAEWLRARHVDTLVITGLSTSGCVRASATDALCHGFVPLVVGEACGDRDQSVHRANLFDLASKYADVVSADWASAYLRGTSDPG
jgi:maleamate amidohydrolase